MTNDPGLREGKRIKKEIVPLNKRRNALMKKVEAGSITAEERAKFDRLGVEIHAKLSLMITAIDGGMPE